MALKSTPKPSLKYPDSMPAVYPANLSELPKSAIDSIEEDKARWLMVYRALNTERPAVIKAWLANLTDDDYREDMRRRLNTRRYNIASARGKK